MTPDRFKDHSPQVRQLVLDFEHQQGFHARFFDADQIEIIADYYLESYDLDGLAAAVDYGERLYPNHTSIRLRRAHLLSIRGQYASALRLLQTLLATEPQNTDIHYSLANIYSLTDRPTLAIRHFLAAASDGCQLGMIYGNIADEYYKMGRTAQAVQYYCKSVEENPDEEHSLLKLANIWQQQGRHNRTIKYLNAHLADHPYSKTAWYAMGNTYYDQARYKQAVDAYEYALAIDSAYFHAYLGLADSHRCLGDTAAAVQTLRLALPYADDRSTILYSIGSVYLDDNNLHTAYTYLREAVQDDASFSLAWVQLAHCSERMGYMEEAAGQYRRAADLEPDVDEYWLQLGEFYIRCGQYDVCADLLETARTTATNPYPFDILLVLCYYHLGCRNRMFDILQRNAPQYAALYPLLLRQYPELAADLELVNFIQQWSDTE